MDDDQPYCQNENEEDHTPIIVNYNFMNANNNNCYT